MMTARAKRVLSYAEEVQKENTDFLIEQNDDFFDLIDGVIERQNKRTSLAVSVTTAVIKAQLDFASKVFEIVEDAIVINRLNNAPILRAFNIDVGANGE